MVRRRRLDLAAVLNGSPKPHGPKWCSFRFERPAHHFAHHFGSKMRNGVIVRVTPSPRYSSLPLRVETCQNTPFGD
jgi:hypothetical protein